MRTTFIETLVERASRDPSIFLMTPDMGYSVFEKYIEKFPSRYLNVGIAEQNAIGIAAGLAKTGFKVYIYSIVPFVTMRCFEQVRLDIAYMGSDVKLVGVGEGFSYGPAGATHHAIEDVAIMRSLPGMKVCCPGDPVEAKAIVEQSFDCLGPMYIRLGKNNEPRIHVPGAMIEIGKAAVLREGADFALLTTGTMLEQGSRWAREWAVEGYDPFFASVHTVKPIDRPFVESLCGRFPLIVTLEEHNVIGGLGSAVAEIVASLGSPTKLRAIGIPDVYSHAIGSQQYLRGVFGIKDRPEIRQQLAAGNRGPDDGD